MESIAASPRLASTDLAPSPPWEPREPGGSTSERERVARKLHDALSQTLFAANLLAGTLARAEDLGEAARGQALTLERLNRSALADMRMMLFELQPEAIDSVRLPELLQHAVDSLAGRGGVKVTTAISHEPGPPTPVRREVYHIALEALSNIGRHSGASNVHVAWAIQAGGRGRLDILDDGRGFNPEVLSAGCAGLELMQRRAAGMGAELSIKSAPSEGTELKLEITWS
jgi:signal transduction histidine kinase